MLKTVKHDNKLNYILEKGMEIMWSKGYNGTSVNDIVKAAGVPKGSFYFYFESKEDFAIKLLDKYFECQFTPAKEILENKLLSPKERLLQFHEHRYYTLKDEMHCKMGCMMNNLGNEMSEHNENIRKAVFAKDQYIVGLITDVIREAQDLGEVENKIDARVIASFIEDAGKGAMVSMKELKSSEPIDNFMTMIKEVLLK